MNLNQLQSIFEKHIPDYNDKSFLLACSGGPDSMALAYAMSIMDLNFAIAHLNYGLRFEDADEDEQMVTKFADQHEIALHVQRYENKLEKKTGESVQMAARRLRYSYFSGLMNDHQYDYCVTAHHLDDNIETFFLNLTRGAGVKGLRGMKFVNGKIFRPLLEISKTEIYHFNFTHEVSYRLDASNDNDYYKRNLIRNKILTEFHKHFPAFGLKMMETFKYMKDVDYLIEAAVNDWKKNHVKLLNNKTIISKKALLENKAGKTILKEILAEFGISASVSNDIFDNLACNSGATFHSAEKSIIVNRSDIEISNEFVQFSTRYFLPQELFDIYISHHLPSSEILENKEICVLDADKINGEFTVRTWRNGDYFFPKGMLGKKKLSDYYNDQKMGRFEKEEQLLLCIGTEIAWIVNRRIDRRFAAENNTTRYAIIAPLKNQKTTQ